MTDFAIHNIAFDLDHLNLNALKLFNSTQSRRVFFCAYKVTLFTVSPFLSYVLKRSEQGMENENLQLPYYDIPLDVNIYTNDELLSMMDIYIKMLFSNFSCDFDQIVYKGSLLWNKDLYLIYDITNSGLILPSVRRCDTLWFGLVDEIANLKHICDIPVDSNVTSFFLSNSKLLQLKERENNNKSVDVPMVVYAAVNYTRMKYTLAFGFSSRKTLFTNFTYATKDALKKEKQNEKDVGAILRVALFMSSTKIERWENDNDNDNVWTHEEYDSIIYTGVEDKISFVIKDLRQHLPLSYHYVEREGSIL